MRLDLVLVRLRFAKTRSAARALIEAGHLRCNGKRITQSSYAAIEGDVLTFPVGKQVKIIEILQLPERRGPAMEAQSCYRTLDPAGQSALAEETERNFKGNRTP